MFQLFITVFCVHTPVSKGELFFYFWFSEAYFGGQASILGVSTSDSWPEPEINYSKTFFAARCVDLGSFAADDLSPCTASKPRQIACPPPPFPSFPFLFLPDTHYICECEWLLFAWYIEILRHRDVQCTEIIDNEIDSIWFDLMLDEISSLFLHSPDCQPWPIQESVSNEPSLPLSAIDCCFLHRDLIASFVEGSD